jgi:2-hydroxy-3-oxopropionate reductase
MKGNALQERIGFIGLGLMGKPMARNLALAGYSLVVHNRSRAAVRELTSEHRSIQAAESPADVVSRTDVVITMLPDSSDVEHVALGENGLITGLSEGNLLIDMSTIAPSTAVEINAALSAVGASSLDAPVSGGDKGAIDATLSIMVGGSEADFARATPILKVLGKTIVHCGGPGSGQIVKACNQIVVGIAYQAASEALVLGAKAGVDPAKVIEVLSGGLAATGVLNLRGQKMIQGDFEPGGRAELHLKDLGIALATGQALNVPLPVTSVVAEKYRALIAEGLGHLDHSALLKLQQDTAGFRLSLNQ